MLTEIVAKKSRNHLGAIPGFTNYNEAEHYAFSKWKDIVEDAYKRHGFTPFQPRPVEFSHHLLEKGGEDKQIYGLCRLQDDSVTDLGIPFDHTIPLAIFVAQRMNELVLPYKRYDVTNSFRGEHPQVGRFRGFLQADVDIVDKNMNILADFECIHTIIDALENIKIGPFTVNINHIVIAKGIIASVELLKGKEAEVLRWIDKMDKYSKEEVIQEISNLVPQLSVNIIKGIIEKFSFSGSPDSFSLDFNHDHDVEKALQDVKILHEMLIAAGVDPKNLNFAPGKVRGLNYYTGIVFETFLHGKEKYGSIASGGRYSNLIDNFVEKKGHVEGVGASIGLTRLFDLLNRSNEIPMKRKTTANILVAYRTVEFQLLAAELASTIRKQGEYVDLYTNPIAKITNQLVYANKKGIPSIVMVMEHNNFVFKNLTNGSQLEFSTKEELINHCTKLI